MAKRGRVKKRQPRRGGTGDAEFAAMQAVYTALENLDTPAQNRVLDYVFRRLSLSGEFGVAESHFDSRSNERAGDNGNADDTEREEKLQGVTQDGLEGISPVAQKWMRRNGLTAANLGGLFSLGVDEIDLVADKVPGKNKKQKLRNVILLLGIASYLGTGAARITYARLKEAAGHYGAQDQANFATNMKELSSDVAGTREAGYSLTAKGLTGATQLVKELSAATGK